LPRLQVYCSATCQRDAWKEHKKVCESLGEVRKEAKKKETDQVKKVNMFNDATGTGSAMLLYQPSAESILVFNRGLVNKVAEFKFVSVDDLPIEIQFLLSCGFIPNLERVKRLLPLVCPLELRVPGAGFTALDWAARKGLFDIAQLLCQSEPGLVHLGAPVGWACYTNRVELAKMLVSHGANPNTTDQVLYSFKPTAFVAAENGSLLALKWLAEEAGVDIKKLRDRSGGGILAVIATSRGPRVPNNPLLPAAVACAQYARSKGASQ